MLRFLAIKETQDPVAIAQAGIAHAKANGHNVVIIDTAGRLAVDEAMMTEISNIHKAIQPQETLFVVDSMTGQDAVNTAKAFNDILNFDGVILTKLDGDTRGGAAISIKSVVNKPIKFIGTGEKMEAIDVFYPARMADRILGMGDVVSLVERAQEQFDEEEARKLQKKIAKNQFGFDDFLKQIQQIKKMGNMKDLIGMIPGAGKMMKDVDIDDDAFKGIEAIIHSMTPKRTYKSFYYKCKSEKTNWKRFRYFSSRSESALKAIQPNEQNDEDDARWWRKKNDASHERHANIYIKYHLTQHYD